MRVGYCRGLHSVRNGSVACLAFDDKQSVGEAPSMDPTSIRAERGGPYMYQGREGGGWGPSNRWEGGGGGKEGNTRVAPLR